MKKLLGLLMVIATILIFLVTSLFIFVSLMSYITKKPFEVFGYSYGIVETRSMTPQIVPGDFVIIHTIDYDALNIGDTIAYTSVSNVTIVHQIIESTPSGFITQGINNHTSDFEVEGYITAERVLGKITWYGGHEVGAIIINNREAIIGSVVILIGVFFIVQIITMVRLMMKKQQLKQASDVEKLKQALREQIEKTSKND